MKKIIVNILVAIYAVIAIFTTVCLLSYNEYKISEFGDNSLILVTNDDLNPDFKKGDLVIVNAAKKKEIIAGDKVFFYNSHDRKVDVSLAKVTKKTIVTSTESTFTLEGDVEISSQYVIGSTRDSSVIPKIANVLSVIESKWGFLFLIVLPSLIAFLYEISVVFMSIKEAKKEEKKES